MMLSWYDGQLMTYSNRMCELMENVILGWLYQNDGDATTIGDISVVLCWQLNDDELMSLWSENGYISDIQSWYDEYLIACFNMVKLTDILTAEMIMCAMKGVAMIS